ncbi:hypothetical protein [Buttiauxella ferragutiae]|uniref:hypothetical protein n=1 Tax=Buttiauxella ferragutiae TaxID=82989 RepID=UPI0035259D06
MKNIITIGAVILTTAVLCSVAHAGTTDYENVNSPRVCHSGNTTLTVSGNKTTIKVAGSYRVQTVTVHLDGKALHTVRGSRAVIVGPWHHLYIASAVATPKGSMLDEAEFIQGCQVAKVVK